MHEEFAQRALSVVQLCFGGLARISRVELIKDWERNTIARLFLEGGEGTGAPAPASVVAKEIKTSEARGFSDLAGLRFLGGIPGMDGVAPRLYGSSEDRRLFLMEDLGGSRSLEQVLAEGDAEETLRHLETLARTQARMVAATLGPQREKEYLAIRQQYPGIEETGREVEVNRWRSGLTRVKQLAEHLGIPMERRLALSLQQLAQSYLEMCDALAYSHGDPAPTNNHVAADGRVRLLDFEYGAYRHLYYDLSGWHILCPLPEPWITRMVAAFRAELAASLPLAADDAWHVREWAWICAYRAIAMLTWMPEEALEADRPWVGQWSVRSAMISTSLRLGLVTRYIQELQPLHELGVQLTDAMRTRWPDLGDGALVWPGS